MYILYMHNDYHEYYHAEFMFKSMNSFDMYYCNEGFWLVPGTDPEDCFYTYA